MRFLRPSLWLAGAAGAMVGFAALGGLTDVPLRWSDLGGWLDEVPVEDALVELARWLGMALSVYVIVVSVLVLLGELAASVRAVPMARLLHRVAGVVAVPALHRRLVEASTATAITVSAMSATGGGGALAASPAAEQTVDVASFAPEMMVLPAGVDGADVVGFGYDPAAPVMPAQVRVVVGPDDTVWDIAVAHYGFCDQSIVELVAAASGLADPNLIFVGQVLVLPPLPVAAAVPAAPAPPVVSVDAATWSVHMIVVGDTLWDILEGHYGFVTGDLVWEVAVYNSIEDPSDIPVGTPVTLPPLTVLTGEAPSTTAAPTPASPVDEAPAPVVTTVDAAPVAPADVAPPDLEAPPVSAAPPPAPVLSSIPVNPVVDEGLPATATTPSTEDLGDNGGGPVAPWLVGLAGATTLSAGLLAVYRRLRRRQTSAGARAWRLMPAGESARLHRQLVAAADLPLVRWAGQEISGVLFGLGRPVAGPVAVELSDLTGVELLWDAPMPDAPAPWEATPGGWSWRLLYDPAAEVPESALPAAIPGLVTLGRRDDAQVLVDLEAFGSVSISGDTRAAEDVMRAVVLELGSGEELSDAWVSTVGLGIDGVEHLSRVQARSDTEALQHASGIAADERRVLADAGVEGTFVLRASGPAASREVTVIAVRAESCEVLDELVALATPRSGLVLVALGPVVGAGLHAVVDDTGAMDLEPLGIALDSNGVSHEAASNTAVLLDGAAEHLTVEDLDPITEDDAAGPGDGVGVATADQSAPEPGRVVEEVAALWRPDGVDLVAAGDLLAGDEPDVEWELPTPALLVRVLGKPRLEPEPSKLTRHERMVVVHVASSGGEATESAIRDAVWGGGLVTDKRFWNVVGHIRSQLGAEICPVRATGPRSKLVRLADALTDLDLLEAMAAQAERVPSTEALALLVEGLAFVYGEPFDDVGYQWAIDQQLPFRAAQAIESAALRAVELALAADDVVAARTAVAQGLIGLPGNELLYRARMRIEAHAGNRAGIRSVYAELVSVLEDLSADTADAGDPSPATKQLFEQLVASACQD